MSAQPITDTKARDAGPGRVGVVAVLAVVATALALLLYHLHRNGFWIDELYTLHAIHLPAGEMVLERLKRGHFPLYFLLVKGFLALTGLAPGEGSLRSLSILCWIGAVGSFWALARKFLGPKFTPVAVTMFALNQLLLHQALQVRMYEMVALEAVWMARAYLEVLADPKRTGWKIVFVAACVVAFWTSASIYLVFIGIFYDAWRRRGERRDLLKIALIAAGLVALSTAPGLVFHVASRDRVEIADTKRLDMLLHFGTVLAGFIGEADYLRVTGRLRILQGIGVAFAIFVLYTFWRTNKRRLGGAVPAPGDYAEPLSAFDLETFCYRVAVVPIVIMILSFPLAKISKYHISILGPSRYLIGLVPFGVMFSASVLCRVVAARRRGMEIAWACVTVVGLLGAVLILRIESDPFRERLRILVRDYSPEDGLMCITEEIAEGIQVYEPGARIDLTIGKHQKDETALVESMRKLASKKVVWFVWYGSKKATPLKAAEKALGPAERIADGTRLRVYRFRPEAMPGSDPT